MQIHAISKQNNLQSFNGLKYQHGVQTKSALNSKLGGVTNLLEHKCEGLKNVDIILTDEGKLQLDVIKPRYLDEKFQRFYLERNYRIGLNRKDGHICFDNNVEHDYLKISLVPTVVPGIFDVLSWHKNPNLGADVSNTLKAAELIENVFNDIDAAEKEHGMDCVSVLNNIDKLTLEAELTRLVDEIKKSYTVTHEKQLAKNGVKELYLLINNRETVDSFKHYKIALVGNDRDSFIAPCLVDTEGYLSEVYNDFYKKEGLVVQDEDDFHKNIKPSFGDYPIYSFGSKDGQAYHVFLDAYEFSHNLSSLEENNFGKLLSIVERLDKVGGLIKKFIESGN